MFLFILNNSNNILQNTKYEIYAVQNVPIIDHCSLLSCQIMYNACILFM